MKMRSLIFSEYLMDRYFSHKIIFSMLLLFIIATSTSPTFAQAPVAADCDVKTSAGCYKKLTQVCFFEDLGTGYNQKKNTIEECATWCDGYSYQGQNCVSFLYKEDKSCALTGAMSNCKKENLGPAGADKWFQYEKGAGQPVNNSPLVPTLKPAPLAPAPLQNNSKSTVSAPTVSVPTVDAPTVSVPKVSAPTVSAPTVSAPKVSAPTVSAPTVSAPTVSAPTVSAPKVSAPTVSAPTVSAPTVSAPTVSAPKVSAPTVNEATVSAPTVNKPTVSAPTVNEPTVNAPIVNSSTVSTPTIKIPRAAETTHPWVRSKAVPNIAKPSVAVSTATAPKKVPASESNSATATTTSAPTASTTEKNSSVSVETSKFIHTFSKSIVAKWNTDFLPGANGKECTSGKYNDLNESTQAAIDAACTIYCDEKANQQIFYINDETAIECGKQTVGAPRMLVTCTCTNADNDEILTARIKYAPYSCSLGATASLKGRWPCVGSDYKKVDSSTP